jgi:hypothetical protein
MILDEFDEGTAVVSGRVVSTPASYSGGPEFISRPGNLS